MPTLLLIIFLLALLVAALYLFANADPHKLAARSRMLTGLVVLALAGVLAIFGRWALALPLAFFGATMLFRGGSFPIPGWTGGQATPGQTSRVRSRFLDVSLDHDTGTLSGQVRVGAYAGRDLDLLGEDNLRSLYAEISGDAESVALLETYLDRRFPDWREKAGAGPRGTGASGTAAAAGPMTLEEARNVLGVAPGAGAAEIRAAHRRLMKNMHPDRGGSTWLASKLNEARDLLLKQAKGKR